MFGINTYLLFVVILKRSVIRISVYILPYSIFIFNLCSVTTFLGAFCKITKSDY